MKKKIKEYRKVYKYIKFSAKYKTGTAQKN